MELFVNNVPSSAVLYRSINGVPYLYSYSENATENKTFAGYVSTIYGEVTCTGTFTLINSPPPPSGIQCSLSTSPSNPITPGANVTTTMTAVGPVTQAMLGTNSYNPPSFPIALTQSFPSDGYVTGVVFDSGGASNTCKAKVTTTNNVMCTLTATPDSINSDGGGVNVTLNLTVLGNAASVNLNGTDMPVAGQSYSAVVPNVVGTKNFIATVTGGANNKKPIQCGTTVFDTGNATPKSCTVTSNYNPAPRNASVNTWITPNDPYNIVGSTIDGQNSGTGLSYYFGSGFMNTKFVYATVTWANGQTANCNYRQVIEYDPCTEPTGSGGLCVFDPLGYTCNNFMSTVTPPVECRGADNNSCESCQDYPPGAECKPPWVTITCPLAAIGIPNCVWTGCATDQGFGANADECMTRAQAEGYDSFIFMNCPPTGSPTGSPSTSP